MKQRLEPGINPLNRAYREPVACARAVYRLAQEGQTGARTILDIPIGYLPPASPEQLRKESL